MSMHYIRDYLSIYLESGPLTALHSEQKAIVKALMYWNIINFLDLVHFILVLPEVQTAKTSSGQQ